MESESYKGQDFSVAGSSNFFDFSLVLYHQSSGSNMGCKCYARKPIAER